MDSSTPTKEVPSVTHGEIEEQSQEEYISFPPLPDPQHEQSQTLSKIFTKTFRKVTSNASQFVHGYSTKPHHYSDEQNMDGYSGEMDMYSVTHKDEQDEEAEDSRIDVQSPSSSGIAEPTKDTKQAKHIAGNEAKESEHNNSGGVKVDTNYANNERASVPPVVKSDNKTLRLSNIEYPNNSTASKSTTNSVVNVNAQAVTDKEVDSSSDSAKPLESNSEEDAQSDKNQSLHNKISSIFNNLPNDIELSDDSASDMETINNSFSVSPNNIANVGLNWDTPMYSDSTAKSSPVKAERKRDGQYPKENHSSLSSIHAIYSKDNGSLVKRKTSSNLSAIIYDNAKSMINSNLTGVVSSASSIVGVKRRDRGKKKKPKRTSENPLKAGGIPKKYWMNDAFVSDCLNCFKPFTAFRRKHHCRFCGQIFCSDCTLFISYNQHKVERTGRSQNEKQPFNDKLRVCKPCYSDVIVYLSEDSSSSSSSDLEDDILLDNESDRISEENSHLSGHVTRARSYSSTSRKDSIRNEHLNTTNRSFLQTELKGQSSDNSLHDHLKVSNSPMLESAKLHKDPSHPRKNAPNIAIPTTRTGESIEIPLSKSSRITNLSTSSLSTFDSASKTANSVSSLPKNDFFYNNHNKSWFKNYNGKKTANLSSNEISHSKSFDNIGHAVNNLINMKPKGRFRIRSGTDHDIHQNGLEEVRSDTSSDRDEDFESENEDERVMSLYTSLNHTDFNSNPSAALSPRTPVASSVTVVPTLGEFPTMMVNDNLFPRSYNSVTPGSSFSKLFQAPTTFHSSQPPKNHSVAFLEDNPKSDNIRSHERAHASLLRMRSRRKSKSSRNVSILTRNNSKLVNSDANYLAPVSSPGNSPISIKPTLTTHNSTKSNLTEIGQNDATGKDVTREYSSPHRPDVNSNQSLVDTPEVQKVQIQDASPSITIDNSLAVPNAMSNGLVDSTDLKYVLSNQGKKRSISTNSYDKLLEVILFQCLDDCNIVKNRTKWVEVLKVVLSYVDNVRLTDTLDIKQYVKIKKLFGGHLEDTSVLNGLFLTKNIDSKRMPSSIMNPKIALLMFPIEYLKQKEQFISLRIIHSQQSVYITNLVSRLITLEPDVIVVGDSVCGLAEKLLEEANITVISNTKPQVVERLSRYTKADIFQSVNDLFFKKGSLGTCEKFEMKKFKHQNIVKTFLFFTGCDPQSGYTISIRGGDEDLLNNIKYTAESTISGFLNAKFEYSFLENSFIEVLEEPANYESLDLIQKVENYNGKMINLEADGIVFDDEALNYLKSFSERRLSVSPIVKFPMPSILLKLSESFMTLAEFQVVNSKIQNATSLDDVDEQWLKDLNVNLDIEKLPNRDHDIISTLKFASMQKLDYLASNYFSRQRRWTNSISNITSYQLYPIFHASIHLLQSTVSIKYSTPCYGPSIIVINYYTDNDKCLGLFLDHIFHESSSTCNECGELLLNHSKTFTHDHGKLDFILEPHNPMGEENIIPNQRTMWSYCKECGASTSRTVMSDEAFYLSVGKFFELSFYGSNIKVFSSTQCNHDYFKDYVRCFGYNNLVIRVEYTDIDSYEVLVPRKQLIFVPDIDIKLKVDSYNHIKSKTEKFFQSISKRLNRVKVDTFDKVEDGLKCIEELKAKQKEQFENIESKTLHIYNSTLPTDYLSLNTILRNLQELGVEWDNEFNEFERKFLPSENEITKITQFHLRNFLMDKYEGQQKEDSPNEKKGEKSNKERDKNSANGNQNDSSTDKEQKSQNEDSDTTDGSRIQPLNQNTGHEIGDMIPSSLYQQSSILKRISQIESLLEREKVTKKEEEVKTPPRKSLSHKSSSVSLNQSQPTRVSQLTNFFNQMNLDQISLEFKKQREQELKKKLNKFKAIPIVKSKPIVEIYSKIEDAVDVAEEDKARKVSSEYKNKNDFFDFKLENRPQGEGTNFLTDTKDEANDESKEFKDNKNNEMLQPEKQSLIKSLTNFWADRSATLWDPLDYPLDSNEHTFADSDVIVREDEPSSLVAFCLDSNDYNQKVKAMELDNVEEENFGVNDTTNKKLNNFIKIEKKFKKRISSDNEGNELEKVMNKMKSNHLRYQFMDGNTNLSCKIFFSEQFEALRKACGANDHFIQSLSRCVKWNSSGGKSRSNFLKTVDDRYIVKELSKSELESFVAIAPYYFKYISQSVFNTLTTAIAKIFGFYQVEIKNTITGKTFRMDFLIMENLFYNRRTTRIFDLKGSMRNRHVKQTGKENEVLLDENMIEYIYESPLFVREHSKKLLRGSLFNDTSFLSAMDIMDYSLIIGIDDTSHRLHVGIIDWLRTFTWDKKVENWVKGKNLMGKKGKDPTIVTPKQYRIRFREAMERYILEVPDIWYEGQ